MKVHKSLPQNEGFFGYYAKLIPTLFKVGFLSQAFSACIEIYILYSILRPKFQGVTEYPERAALIGALFLVALLEIGLRSSAAYSVRAVLYRKFRGLDLPMTVFIFLLTGSLLLCSVVLHIEGAKEAVEANTAGPQLEETAHIETSGQSEAAGLLRSYSQDSATIAAAYAARINSTRAEYQAREREYLARKGATRAGAAKIRTKGEAKIAALEAERGGKFERLLERKDARLERVKSRQFAALDDVTGRNKKRIERSEARLDKYSSYLSTFSVLTVLFFLLTIALNEIHKKGSGIEEVAIPNQYQFEQPLFAKLATAVNGKFQYHARRAIDRIEESTPHPGAPLAPAPLYDWSGLMPERVRMATRANGYRTANRTSERPVSVTIPAEEEARPFVGAAVPAEEAATVTRARNNATVTTAPAADAAPGFALKCKNCKEAFTARVAWQKFCCETCKFDYHERQRGKRFNPKQYRKRAGK